MSYLLSLIKNIYEPFLEKTLSEMAIDLQCEESTAAIAIEGLAGFPLTPLHGSLSQLITNTLWPLYPQKKVTIDLDFFVKAHATQMPGYALKGIKNTIAVASGKGGVGKSSVAINLATALSRAGARVGILDADIYGPSIPMMLGGSPTLSLNETSYQPILAHGLQAMSMGYLTASDQALIWRGPMLAKSLFHLINTTAWDELDYLFIDLPPGTGDIQLSLVQKIPLTGAIIVTTPQPIATIDAQKAIRMFQKTNIKVLGIVENMSIHVCPHCAHQESLFGQQGGEQLSQLAQAPMLGQVPLDKRIREHCDEGTPIALKSEEPVGALFMKMALNLAIEVAKMPLNIQPIDAKGR